MQKLIGCIVIIMLFLIGCSNESSTEKVPSTITLTPLTLFENDEKKYEPFLGPMSGAFKLTYKGDRPNANLNVASWKKGEIVESHNIIFDLFFASDNRVINEIEIIVSMNLVTKEGQEDMMEVKINNKTEFGYSFVTSSAPWAKELTTKGLIRHQEPIQFTTEKPIHIFGLHGISTNTIYPADFSTESLERLEHAIILTLTFDDEY